MSKYFLCIKKKCAKCKTILNFFQIMIFKKSIENLVYLGLYALSLVLFFLWGNIGNNKIIFSAAHILCVYALVINSNRKIASFFLKSLTIFSLVSSMIWAADLPYTIGFIPFIVLGFTHVMIIDDKDLFGKLADNKEPTSLIWARICLWAVISIAVMTIFITA